MKNKKTRMLLVVVSIFIVVLFVFLLFVFISKTRVSTESLQDTITNAWSCEETEESVPKFISAIEPRANFNVIDFTDNGEGHYSVMVEVTAPDISQKIIEYQNSITEIVGIDKIDENLKTIIEEAEPKTTQHTLTVIYTDKEPEVKFTDEFIDAMYGYAYIYSIKNLEHILTF